jgi:hypothetical protein
MNDIYIYIFNSHSFLFLTAAFNAFKTASGKEVSAEDILIAEGNATLELADQQYEEGMHRSAARNYHTATVYFRVLESMVPRLTSRVHASLTYAASRTQQSSHLLANLVHEHFEVRHLINNDVFNEAINIIIGHSCFYKVLKRFHNKVFRYLSNSPS